METPTTETLFPLSAITAARKARGLTQKELSALTGISQGDISQIEKGTLNPSLKLLRRIAAAMDMKLIINLEPLQPPRP